MKNLPERNGSLSYGLFDERPPIGRWIMISVIFSVMGLVCYSGYYHGVKLEQAALGGPKPAARVTKKQEKKAGQITEGNREWLTSIAKRGE
jgi:hypothetical protein